MNTLRQAVQEYLSLRRSLGFKLEEAGKVLPDFVAFMERHRASCITQALALRWVPRVKEDESSASIRMRVMALRQRWRA